MVLKGECWYRDAGGIVFVSGAFGFGKSGGEGGIRTDGAGGGRHHHVGGVHGEGGGGGTTSFVS